MYVLPSNINMLSIISSINSLNCEWVRSWNLSTSFVKASSNKISIVSLTGTLVYRLAITVYTGHCEIIGVSEICNGLEKIKGVRNSILIFAERFN